MDINPNHLIITNWSDKTRSAWSLNRVTGIQVYHKPTDTYYQCDDYASPHRNRAECMVRLKDVLDKLKPEPKRTSMTYEDAEILLDAYDSWAGSLHPDAQEEYLAQFDGLHKRIAKENENG